MTLGGLARALYRAARAQGDVRAIRRGTYPKRVSRRAVYRAVGGWLRAWLR